MTNPNPNKSFSNIYCIFFNMTLLGGNLWRLIIKLQFKKLFNSVENSDGGLLILQKSGSWGPKNPNPQLTIHISHLDGIIYGKTSNIQNTKVLIRFHISILYVQEVLTHFS